MPMTMFNNGYVLITCYNLTMSDIIRYRIISSAQAVSASNNFHNIRFLENVLSEITK